jgi:enamine deaminase RidA (YjgF/YER057c/UK114 family)
VKPRPSHPGGKALDAASSPRDRVERYRSGGPPAATMVVVDGLLDMRMLVEVEVVAYRRMIT